MSDVMQTETVISEPQTSAAPPAPSTVSDSAQEHEVSVEDAIQRAFEQEEADRQKDKDEAPKEEKPKDEPKAEKKPKTEAKPEKADKAEKPEVEDDSENEEPAEDDGEQEGTEGKKGEGKSEASSGESEDDAPPPRFRLNDRKAWDSADPQLKSEVKRALSEMDSGIQKYKASHDSYEPLRELDEYAKSTGTNLRDAVMRLHSAEQQLFSKDQNTRFSALNDLVQKSWGMSIHQLAAQVAKIPQTQVSQQKDQQIAHLSNKLASIEQKLQAQEATVQQEKARTLNAAISEFSSSSPRFEELRPVMAQLLNSKVVPETGNVLHDLKEAYAAADRLKPAANGASYTPQSEGNAKTSNVTATNGRSRASKAISGANTGSGKTSEKIYSVDEAIQMAMNGN